MTFEIKCNELLGKVLFVVPYYGHGWAREDAQAPTAKPQDGLGPEAFEMRLEEFIQLEGDLVGAMGRLLNLYVPTIARVVPTKLTLMQLLGYELFSRNEGKIAYIELNIQTPCPPRGAVPVNQECFWSSFTLNTRIVFGNGCDCTSYIWYSLPRNTGSGQR